jgi:hypothetical protein
MNGSSSPERSRPSATIWFKVSKKDRDRFRLSRYPGTLPPARFQHALTLLQLEKFTTDDRAKDVEALLLSRLRSQRARQKFAKIEQKRKDRICRRWRYAIQRVIVVLDQEKERLNHKNMLHSDSSTSSDESDDANSGWETDHLDSTVADDFKAHTWSPKPMVSGGDEFNGVCTSPHAIKAPTVRFDLNPDNASQSQCDDGAKRGACGTGTTFHDGIGGACSSTLTPMRVQPLTVAGSGKLGRMRPSRGQWAPANSLGRSCREACIQSPAGHLDVQGTTHSPIVDRTEMRAAQGLHAATSTVLADSGTNREGAESTWACSTACSRQDQARGVQYAGSQRSRQCANPGHLEARKFCGVPDTQQMQPAGLKPGQIVRRVSDGTEHDTSLSRFALYPPAQADSLYNLQVMRPMHTEPCASTPHPPDAAAPSNAPVWQLHDPPLGSEVQPCAVQHAPVLQHNGLGHTVKGSLPFAHPQSSLAAPPGDTVEKSGSMQPAAAQHVSHPLAVRHPLGDPAKLSDTLVSAAQDTPCVPGPNSHRLAHAESLKPTEQQQGEHSRFDAGVGETRLIERPTNRNIPPLLPSPSQQNVAEPMASVRQSFFQQGAIQTRVGQSREQTWGSKQRQPAESGLLIGYPEQVGLSSGSCADSAKQARIQASWHPAAATHGPMQLQRGYGPITSSRKAGQHSMHWSESGCRAVMATSGMQALQGHTVGLSQSSLSGAPQRPRPCLQGGACEILPQASSALQQPWSTLPPWSRHHVASHTPESSVHLPLQRPCSVGGHEAWKQESFGCDGGPLQLRSNSFPWPPSQSNDYHQRMPYVCPSQAPAYTPWSQWLSLPVQEQMKHPMWHVHPQHSTWHRQPQQHANTCPAFGINPSLGISGPLPGMPSTAWTAPIGPIALPPFFWQQRSDCQVPAFFGPDCGGPNAVLMNPAQSQAPLRTRSSPITSHESMMAPPLERCVVAESSWTGALSRQPVGTTRQQYRNTLHQKQVANAFLPLRMQQGPSSLAPIGAQHLLHSQPLQHHGLKCFAKQPQVPATEKEKSQCLSWVPYMQTGCSPSGGVEDNRLLASVEPYVPRNQHQSHHQSSNFAFHQQQVMGSNGRWDVLELSSQLRRSSPSSVDSPFPQKTGPAVNADTSFCSNGLSHHHAPKAVHLARTPVPGQAQVSLRSGGLLGGPPLSQLPQKDSSLVLASSAAPEGTLPLTEKFAGQLYDADAMFQRLRDAPSYTGSCKGQPAADTDSTVKTTVIQKLHRRLDVTAHIVHIASSSGGSWRSKRVESNSEHEDANEGELQSLVHKRRKSNEESNRHVFSQLSTLVAPNKAAPNGEISSSLSSKLGQSMRATSMLLGLCGKALLGKNDDTRTSSPCPMATQIGQVSQEDHQDCLGMGAHAPSKHETVFDCETVGDHGRQDSPTVLSPVERVACDCQKVQRQLQLTGHLIDTSSERESLHARNHGDMGHPDSPRLLLPPGKGHAATSSERVQQQLSVTSHIVGVPMKHEISQASGSDRVLSPRELCMLPGDGCQTHKEPRKVQHQLNMTAHSIDKQQQENGSTHDMTAGGQGDPQAALVNGMQVAERKRCLHQQLGAETGQWMDKNVDQERCGLVARVGLATLQDTTQVQVARVEQGVQHSSCRLLQQQGVQGHTMDALLELEGVGACVPLEHSHKASIGGPLISRQDKSIGMAALPARDLQEAHAWEGSEAAVAHSQQDLTRLQKGLNLAGNFCEVSSEENAHTTRNSKGVSHRDALQVLLPPGIGDVGILPERLQQQLSLTSHMIDTPVQNEPSDGVGALQSPQKVQLMLGEPACVADTQLEQAGQTACELPVAPGTKGFPATTDIRSDQASQHSCVKQLGAEISVSRVQQEKGHASVCGTTGHPPNHRCFLPRRFTGEELQEGTNLSIMQHRYAVTAHRIDVHERGQACDLAGPSASLQACDEDQRGAGNISEIHPCGAMAQRAGNPSEHDRDCGYEPVHATVGKCQATHTVAKNIHRLKHQLGMTAHAIFPQQQFDADEAQGDKVQTVQESLSTDSQQEHISLTSKLQAECDTACISIDEQAKTCARAQHFATENGSDVEGWLGISAECQEVQCSPSDAGLSMLPEVPMQLLATTLKHRQRQHNVVSHAVASIPSEVFSGRQESGQHGLASCSGAMQVGSACVACSLQASSAPATQQLTMASLPQHKPSVAGTGDHGLGTSSMSARSSGTCLGTAGTSSPPSPQAEPLKLDGVHPLPFGVQSHVQSAHPFSWNARTSPVGPAGSLVCSQWHFSPSRPSHAATEGKSATAWQPTSNTSRPAYFSNASTLIPAKQMPQSSLVSGTQLASTSRGCSPHCSPAQARLASAPLKHAQAWAPQVASTAPQATHSRLPLLNQTQTQQNPPLSGPEPARSVPHSPSGQSIQALSPLHSMRSSLEGHPINSLSPSMHDNISLPARTHLMHSAMDPNFHHSHINGVNLSPFWQQNSANQPLMLRARPHTHMFSTSGAKPPQQLNKLYAPHDGSPYPEKVEPTAHVTGIKQQTTTSGAQEHRIDIHLSTAAATAAVAAASVAAGTIHSPRHLAQLHASPSPQQQQLQDASNGNTRLLVPMARAIKALSQRCGVFAHSGPHLGEIAAGTGHGAAQQTARGGCGQSPFKGTSLDSCQRGVNLDSGHKTAGRTVCEGRPAAAEQMHGHGVQPSESSKAAVCPTREVMHAACGAGGPSLQPLILGSGVKAVQARNADAGSNLSRGHTRHRVMWKLENLDEDIGIAEAVHADACGDEAKSTKRLDFTSHQLTGA